MISDLKRNQPTYRVLDKRTNVDILKDLFYTVVYRSAFAIGGNAHGKLFVT